MFRKLFWSDLGELVPVMEHDLGCLMDFLMSCVNHGSGGGLVGAFRGARGGGEEKRYIKLVEEK